MPAEPDWEIDETEKEGIKLVYLTAPVRAIGENGKLKAVECIKMQLLDETDSSPSFKYISKPLLFELPNNPVIKKLGGNRNLLK
jgi:NADPH-dependent glutamate synthase beta subunit-like oxidoreductase